MLYETEQMLCAVTGLEACSLQPSAGAHGELTGIMLIQAWHRAQGNTRTKMLMAAICSSAVAIAFSGELHNTG